MKTFFDVLEIAPKTWHISEYRNTSMYLLAGEASALLIDTGYGVGDIWAEIRKLTSLPVAVVLTHCHPDHMGGIGHFDEIYVQARDWEAVWNTTEEQVSELITFFGLDTPGTFPRAFGDFGKLRPLSENDVFDLGGRTVTVYETPGHSPGSVVLLDSQTEFLFSGDICNPHLLLSVPQNMYTSLSQKTCFESVETLRRSLEKMKTIPCKKIYNGHFDELGQQPLYDGIIDQQIENCRKILEDRAPILDRTEFPFVQDDCCRYAVEGRSMLVYNPKSISASFMIEDMQKL